MRRHRFLTQPRVWNALKSAIVVLYIGLEQRQHFPEYHPKTKRALIGLEAWQWGGSGDVEAMLGNRLTCAGRDGQLEEQYDTDIAGLSAQLAKGRYCNSSLAEAFFTYFWT
ncbi:hypothetical protein J6590_103512 [Homalodisca vitripennis]|nr:hypothetical protein J6590_103512 [Homalodisca vitripennis]